MAEPDILLSVDDTDLRGSVARLVADNRARINVLNSDLILRLTSVIESLRHDENLRVVILTGAGDRAFIGGADINEMVGLDPQSARAFITRLHEACAALRFLPVPTIARISGYCLGAGLEVAASCDLRIAADHSTFGMPEVRVGIPSVIEAALLPRLIGWGKTNELLYTGKTISASEALNCRLIERVVSQEMLDQSVDELVEAILEAGPKAVRLQKALIRRWESESIDQAIESGTESFSKAYETDEPHLFMNRFLNRDRNKKGSEL